jgi:hypothetical protein
LIGFLWISLGDEPQVSGDIYPGWTGFRTRWRAFGNELLRGDGAKRPDDIKDRDAIGAYALTSAAGGTGPWKRRVSNLIDEIELNMSKDTPDVKVINTRDRACRTTTPALFTGLKHLYMIKIYFKHRILVHLYSL